MEKQKIKSAHIDVIKKILKEATGETISKPVGVDEDTNCDSVQVITPRELSFETLSKMHKAIYDKTAREDYEVYLKRSGAGINVSVRVKQKQ